MTRFLVSPDTVTVNGYRVKANSSSWLGLDLANAEVRQQSTLMMAALGSRYAPPDVYLRTPWGHPDDLAAGAERDRFYRVRPQMRAGQKWKGQKVKSIAFERWDGTWFLAVEFAA